VQESEWFFGERDGSLPTYRTAGRSKFQDDFGQPIGNAYAAGRLDDPVWIGRQWNSQDLCFALWKDGAVGTSIQQSAEQSSAAGPFDHNGNHRPKEAGKLHVRKLEHHSIPQISAS
jgi:hypothetical protein